MIQSVIFFCIQHHRKVPTYIFFQDTRHNECQTNRTRRCTPYPSPQWTARAERFPFRPGHQRRCPSHWRRIWDTNTGGKPTTLCSPRWTRSAHHTSYFMLVDTVSSRFIRENHATDASMIQYELRQYIIRHAIQVLDLNEIYSYYKITTVGAYAFNACTSLVTVVIPPGVTAVMTHAFSQCVAVTTITVPDSVTTIGDYAFSKCTSLTTLAIPDQVTTIEICAFQKCVSLTTLTISDSVTTIGAYAFENCTSLTDINIPSSGTTIGNCAFDGCPLLQQPPTTSEWSSLTTTSSNIPYRLNDTRQWCFHSRVALIAQSRELYIAPNQPTWVSNDPQIYISSFFYK